MPFQAIIRRRMQFNHWNISRHPKLDENIAKLLQSHNVFPSLKPQSLPDFVINCGEFDIGVKEGTIIPISPVPERRIAVIEPESISTPDPQQIAQSDKEKQAEIETMLDTPMAELTGPPAPGVWPTMGKSGFPSETGLS